MQCKIERERTEHFPTAFIVPKQVMSNLLIMLLVATPRDVESSVERSLALRQVERIG